MKKALITGVSGQDGSYLSELLLNKNYEVHGMVRRVAVYPDSVKYVPKDVELHFGDLQNENHLSALLNDLKPDEIYNLAAQSDVRVSFDIPEYTGEITGIGVTRLLEAIRKFSPKSKLYQASSSEMFGTCTPPQDENGPFLPQNPYAVAKLYAHHMCRIYREAYGMFVCCGILFNHESSRRGKNFVTRKIASAAAKKQELFLGNLDAKRDWGYAPDYVEAMWLMLQQNEPDDFVIGTGETHTVREFVEAAFGVNWENYVKIDKELFRPLETHYLCANACKAWEKLSWKPKVTFNELVRIMVEAEK